MTVRELIELNQMITDIEITVRINGSRLLDQLNIGPAEGVKPPFPTRVPISEKYVKNFAVLDSNHYRDATYIDKSINAWDDGKDYWQVKPKRIPAKWLDLEVYAWEVWPASSAVYGKNRRNDWGNSNKNINFHGQKLIITALPSGESLEIVEPKQQAQEDPQLEGQMNIMDFLEE